MRALESHQNNLWIFTEVNLNTYPKSRAGSFLLYTSGERRGALASSPPGSAGWGSTVSSSFPDHSKSQLTNVSQSGRNLYYDYPAEEEHRNGSERWGEALTFSPQRMQRDSMTWSGVSRASSPPADSAAERRSSTTPLSSPELAMACGLGRITDGRSSGGRVAELVGRGSRAETTGTSGSGRCEGRRAWAAAAASALSANPLETSGHKDGLGGLSWKERTGIWAESAQLIGDIIFS